MKKKTVLISGCAVLLCLGIWIGYKNRFVAETGEERGQKNVAVLPEFVLTYAENQPESYSTTQSAIKFAELVEEQTGGKVRIQVKSDGEFGTQQQMIEQMQFGGIDFARVSVSELADKLPHLNVLQLPFLYEDEAHMWKVLDGTIGSMFMEETQQLDLVSLAWYEAGARSFYSSDRPIEKVEDLDGMTVRVQESQMMMDMISLLGGNPVYLPYGDVYSAFETKKIDAAENNWSSYVISGHVSDAVYFSEDEHTRVPELQLVSGITWEKLPEEYQRIIQECAEEASLYGRHLWKEQEQTSREKAMEKGCRVQNISEEEREKFREKMIPLYEMYCADDLELIEEIRKMCSS